MFEIGSSLREARLRPGLELHDAEAATRIRATYLAALEEERFHQLPADVYACAFLRTYAEFLGSKSSTRPSFTLAWWRAGRCRRRSRNDAFLAPRSTSVQVR